MHNSDASCREIVKSYPPSFSDVQLHIVVRANVRAPIRCAFTAASARRPAFRCRKRSHRKRAVGSQNISRHETRGGVTLRGAAYRRGFPATGARRPHRVGCLIPSATPGQRDRGRCCAVVSSPPRANDVRWLCRPSRYGDDSLESRSLASESLASESLGRHSLGRHITTFNAVVSRVEPLSHHLT
jgi:hypothetical protein